MWEFMSNNESLFVNSTDKGVEKVKKGGYAFLLESTTNEFIRKRECDLIQIGGLLDEKGYGIAGSTGNPLISVISYAILKLQQYGAIQGKYIYFS